MTWQEHFKEQLQLLEGHAELQAGSPELLRYAIDTQVITEEAYFEWLKKHSQNPVLSGSFFTEKTPNLQFWEKYRENFTWSPNLIPVAEWEGKLIVAGLAKPDFLNQDFIFVHTSIMGLQRYWEAYNQSSAPSASSDVGFSFEDYESPELEDESSEASQEEEHETLDLGGNDFVNSPQEKTDINLDFSTLTHTQAAMSSPSSTPPPPPPSQLVAKMAEPEVEATVVEDSVSISLGREPEENANPTSLEKDAGKESVVAAESPARPKIQTAERPLKAVPSDLNVLMAPKQLAYALINWDEKALKIAFQDVFEKMRTHFDKSLIINISDDESRCKVYAWDSAFTTPATDPVINLLNPSIFYIAAKTTKPFHGPVSHSEENEKFFKAWNSNALPAHATLIPLIYSDRVVAILMGIGEPSAYNRATLNFTEKMAAKITETLVTNLKKAA